jgi:hypothetical protein
VHGLYVREDYRTFRIGIAAALGAGIGSILAVAFGLAWPLGALAGGLVGFAAYDPSAVRGTLAAIFAGLWDRLKNRGLGWVWLWEIAFAVSAATTGIVAVAIRALITHDPVLLSSVQFACLMGAGLGLMFAFAISVSIIVNAAGTVPMPFREVASIFKAFATWTNPIGVAIGLAWLTGQALNAFGQLLALIYGRESLVSALSAMAGALIGLTVMGPRPEAVILAAGAGWVLGIAQYRLISVPFRLANRY